MYTSSHLFWTPENVSFVNLKSVFGSRSGSRRAKMTIKNRKKKKEEISSSEVLDVRF
jgi:hypothetical protein